MRSTYRLLSAGKAAGRRAALLAAGLLLVVALAPVGSAVYAGDGVPGHRQAGPASARARRVFVDPQTGERRLPNHRERRRMQRSAPVPVPAPMTITHRDGMTIAHVPRERRMYLHAKKDARGHVRIFHGPAPE